MKERGGGKPGVSERAPFPSDARRFAETRSFKIWISKLEKTVILDVTEYHSGSLFLDEDDLRSMLDHMERAAEPRAKPRQ